MSIITFTWRHRLGFLPARFHTVPRAPFPGCLGEEPALEPGALYAAYSVREPPGAVQQQLVVAETFGIVIILILM